MPDPNGGDEFIKTYVKERNELISAQDLIEFVERWKSIFILCKNENQTEDQSNIYDSLINSTFDIDLAWQCLNTNCDHNICTGLAIMFPVSLLYVQLCSAKFEVSSDVTFIQFHQLHHLW